MDFSPKIDIFYQNHLLHTFLTHYHYLFLNIFKIGVRYNSKYYVENFHFEIMGLILQLINEYDLA